MEIVQWGMIGLSLLIGGGGIGLLIGKVLVDPRDYSDTIF